MPTPLPSPTSVDSTPFVETLGGWTGALSDIAGVVAIAVGGWWAYDRFIRERDEWPRATLEHYIEHFDLGINQLLVRVVEKIKNTGTVILEITERTTLVQQVLPANAEVLSRMVVENEQEAEWPVLGQHVIAEEIKKASIEPGESDHFEHDFVVATDVQVIQVYSYFKNIKHQDREMGWPMTTTYDLRTEDSAKNRVEDATPKEE